MHNVRGLSRISVLLLLGVAFTLLPDPVDIGFVGTGSALGGVMGGLFAAALGQSFEQIAMYAGNGAVAVGLVTLGIWVMGMSGLQLGQ